VTSAYYESDGTRWPAGFTKEWRQQVALKMVDADKRFPKADCETFPDGVPDQQRCQQARSAGSSDAVEIRDCFAGPFQSSSNQGFDFDQMIPGGNLRDNSAKLSMKGHLAGDLRRQQAISSTEYRDGSLVTRSFNREC